MSVSRSPERPAIQPIVPPDPQSSGSWAPQATSSSQHQIPPNRPSCIKCRPAPAADTGIRDPHALHPLRRYYIGPLPVSASAANATARAIAEDELYEAGRLLNTNGAGLNDASSERHIQDQSDMSWQKVQVSPEDIRHGDTEVVAPRKNAPAIQFNWRNPFPKRQGSAGSNVTRWRSSAHFSNSSAASAAEERPRRPIRDPSAASFASARSLPRSVLSETDAADRGMTAFDAASNRVPSNNSSSPTKSFTSGLFSREDRDRRRAFRKENSAAGSLGLGWKPPQEYEPSETASLEPSAAAGDQDPRDTRRIRRIASAGARSEPSNDNSFETELRSHHAITSSSSTGNLAALSSSSDRKRRSEGFSGRIGSGQHVWETSQTGMRPLPLLDMPVTEADESAASPRDETQPIFPSVVPDVVIVDQDKLVPNGHTGSNDSEQQQRQLEPRLIGASPAAERTSVDEFAGSRSALNSGSDPSTPADAKGKKRMRRALSPSFFTRSPSRQRRDGHEVEASDETTIDKAKRSSWANSQDEGGLSADDHVARLRNQASFSSSSPQSTISKAAGKQIALSLATPVPADPNQPDRKTLPATDTQGGVDPVDPNDAAAADSDANAATTQGVSEARNQLLKDRARSKLAQSKVGRGLPSNQRGATVFPGQHSASEADGQRRLPLLGSGVHARDYSRQSRVSRASTAGTLNTVGTLGTEGSFGVSNGMRDKLTRSLFVGGSQRKRKPSKAGSFRTASFRGRRPLPDRETFELGSPHNRPVTTTRSMKRNSSVFFTPKRHERSSSQVSDRRSRLSRNLSIDSRATSHGRHSRMGSSSEALAPGAVGTSSGGTKWVGQSFEIGKRFWEILEARKADVSKEMRCQCADQAPTDPAERELPPVAGSKEPTVFDESPKTNRRKDNRTADSVLSDMAAEATAAGEQKQAQNTSKGSDSDSDSSDESSRVLSARTAFSDLASYVRTTTKNSSNGDAKMAAGPTSGRPRTMQMDQSAASVMTLPHEPKAGQEEAADIESRKGWHDIASLMTAHSKGLPNPLPAIKEKLNEPLKKVQAKVSGDASPKGTDAIESEPKPVKLLSRSSSLNRPNYSPTEDSRKRGNAPGGTIEESDEVEASQVSSQLKPDTFFSAQQVRMTREEALSHPEPPLSVDDKFPELTHELLRRRSDDGIRPQAGLFDAASDHQVAIQPVSTPDNFSTHADKQASDSGFNEDVLNEQDPWLSEDQDLVESPLAELKNPTLDPPKTGVGRMRTLSARSSSLAVPVTDQGGDRLALVPPTTSQPVLPVTASADHASDAAGESPRQRKKTVQFEASAKSPERPSARAVRSASLFATRSADDLAMFGRSKPGDAKPAPPEEVLSRSQPSNEAIGANATEARKAQTFGNVRFDNQDDVITSRSVLKKDRMLVKLGWTPHEDLPKDFDELSSRKYAIREEEWREHIVVLRMGRLELWSDPTLVNKALGHGDRLKLRHTIRLSRGTTFLSIFSPIDHIFCLTYQPWKSLSAQTHKRGLHLRRQGTDIVYLDCRSRTVAVDWMWELWRELGGLIPETLEVHLPFAEVKIRIPIPEEMPVDYVDQDDPEQNSNRPGEGAMALTPIAESRQGGEGFKLINRANIIRMAWNMIHNVPEWREVIRHVEDRGLRLELAWRRGTELDWVINERTIENERRHWAVLSGSILKQVRNPAVLELRPAAHYPTSVRLANGSVLEEPAAVEGYVWRVKPVSGALTRLYLTTHDGHLFVSKPSRAFPPDRHLASELQNALQMRIPKASGLASANRTDAAATGKRSAMVHALARFVGREKIVRREEDMAQLRAQVLEAISHHASNEEEIQAQITAYKTFEKRRQLEQIANSDGFIDLRSIYMIRAVGKGPVRCPGQDDFELKGARGGAAALRRVKEDQEAAQREDEESEPEDGADGDEEDEEDIGGEEGLAMASDRNELRRSRQIEVVLTNGRTSRFEVYSKSVAREWIERMAELAKYWRKRERADALDLLNASGFNLAEFNKRLRGTRAEVAAGSAKVSDSQRSSALSNLWHWCAIEGCRGVIQSGRLYHKTSGYAPFYSRHYVLIAGRLLCFKLVTSQRTARSRQNAGIFHRRKERVIYLRDAYVYSGKLSEDMLQNGRSEPAQALSGSGSNSGNRHRIPRVYGDGLFSFDEDEDCTFVIRYRPARVQPQPETAGSAATSARASVQALDDKTYKTIALRARSKLERDQWVRSVSYEIEKLVREDVGREMRLKNIGRVDHR